MPFHKLCQFAWWPLTFVACLTCGPAWSGERPTQAGEEAAIRQRAKEYLAAVERGDGEELASFWTAEGDYVDVMGKAVEGRRLARQRTASQENHNDSRLAATVESIRFITPQVAVEDGALARATDAGAMLRYTAIWTKQGEAWLLDGVRESAVLAPPHEPLNDLNWMLGDWISDDDHHSVRLACAWSADKHFLLREIDVILPERGPLHVTQRIGWDAHEKQIKSWTFDSEGGHAEGLWFQSGGRWIVESASVLPNGSIATGTNIYDRDGDDAFTWESENAEIDGEPKPDRKVRMVRKPPAKK